MIYLKILLGEIVNVPIIPNNALRQKEKESHYCHYIMLNPKLKLEEIYNDYLLH